MARALYEQERNDQSVARALYEQERADAALARKLQVQEMRARPNAGARARAPRERRQLEAIARQHNENYHHFNNGGGGFGADDRGLERRPPGLTPRDFPVSVYVPPTPSANSQSQSSSLSSPAAAAAATEAAEAARTCDVCMGEYAAGEELKTLPCFHTFHRGCIDEWLKKRMSCPVCRREFG